MKIKIKVVLMLVSILLMGPTFSDQIQQAKSSAARASDTRKDIFSEPENLKVFPEAIKPEQLKAAMKTFSMSLGLRCNACHVGESGEPLQSYDFASDDKKLKLKARMMMEMVQNINSVQLEKLDEIEKSAKTRVTCMTCHRGQENPKLIQRVLDDEMQKTGVQGAIDKYLELRKQYYGSHTFDFSERVLPMFADEYLKGDQNIKNAIKLLETNLTYYPESFMGNYSLAKNYDANGDSVKAIVAYKKALQLNPNAAAIEQRIFEME